MFKYLALPITIAAAFLIAGWAELTPAPQPASAPGFSVERALAIVRTISATPHVSGSPANQKVRDWLVAELQKAGLEVQTQSSFAVRQSVKWPGMLAAPVDNVIAVLPGADRSAPAVALMAHYDAVPYSPGASDDAAGTAVVLDTAKVMARGPKPKRDVVFLFTDAEELGLLGATAFFREHALAKRVGVVVNVEARGSAGRATMFQTSPGNDGLIRLWADHAPNPSGSSLTDAIYKLLPNDTDLSVSLDAGVAGINSAYVGGQFDYHNPTDSVASLDPGSLQHLGEFGQSMTKALAYADSLPVRGQDSAYFDLFGLGVVHYPMALGWLVIAVGACLVLLLAIRTRTAPISLLAGALGTATLVGTAAALIMLLRLNLLGDGVMGDREMLAEQTPLLWVYGLLAMGWTFGGVLLLLHWRAVGGWGLWLGTMGLALLIATAMQVYVPGGSYVFAWPLLVAGGLGLVAAQTGLESAATRWSTMIGGGLVFALAAQLAHQSYTSLGSEVPALLASSSLHGVLLLLPLFLVPNPRGVTRKVTLSLIGAAAVGSVGIYLTDGFSDRYPRPGDLFHLTDAATGQGGWTTSSGASELPPGPVGTIDLQPMVRRAWLTTPSGQETANPVVLSVEAAADGREVLAISAPPVIGLRLLIRSSAELSDTTLNTLPVKLTTGDWTSLRYGSATAADMKLAFRRKPGTTVEVRYMAATPGLPAGAPPPKGPPTNWTLLSGSSAVVGRAVFP